MRRLIGRRARQIRRETVPQMGQRPVRARRRSERGSATVFVLGLMIVLFGFAGLVIDGGDAMNERARMADVAEQAARAGAEQLDDDALRGSGVLSVDCDAARGAVADYMRSVSYSSANVRAFSCDGANQTVTVRTQYSVKTTILQVVGKDHFDVSASATATARTQ